MIAWLLAYAALLSLIFSLGSYIPYWISILQDAHKPTSEQNPPEKATWLIWMSVDLIIGLAMLSQGIVSLQMWAYVVGSGSIAAYALFYGRNGWTKEDKVVLALAGLAIALWPFTSGNVATAISVIAGGIGSWPMWKALWRDPAAAPRLAWWLVWIGGVFGTAAGVHEHGWTLAATLGPAGFLVLQTVIVALGLPIRKKRAIA